MSCFKIKTILTVYIGIEANLINKIPMQLLKQATNSINNCKLILRSLCGEGISIGSPVNMCTIGNKVIWPTGGVICHIPRYPPQITVSVVCRSLSHDGQTSVWCPWCPCAVSAQLSPSGSMFAKSSSHDVSVVEAKRTSHCACIQLFSPEPCLSSALIFC